MSSPSFFDRSGRHHLNNGIGRIIHSGIEINTITTRDRL